MLPASTNRVQITQALHVKNTYPVPPINKLNVITFGVINAFESGKI